MHNHFIRNRDNEILCLYLFPITTSHRHAFYASIKCLATILEKNVLSRPNMEWLTISNILLYERGQKMLEWKCFMYQYFSKTRKTTIINTICGPERVILFGYLMQESKGGGSKKSCGSKLFRVRLILCAKCSQRFCGKYL